MSKDWRWTRRLFCHSTERNASSLLRLVPWDLSKRSVARFSNRDFSYSFQPFILFPSWLEITHFFGSWLWSIFMKVRWIKFKLRVRGIGWLQDDLGGVLNKPCDHPGFSRFLEIIWIFLPGDVLSVNVTGEGFVSDLCKEFVVSFMQITRTANIDPSVCMPHPHIPNFNQYRNIMLLLLSCWILIFLEPYGLRVRQLIMNIHYPKRSNERAAWLYNHILVRRINFIKFARRKMRKQFLKDFTRKKFNEDITCMEMIRAKVVK